MLGLGYLIGLLCKKNLYINLNREKSSSRNDRRSINEERLKKIKKIMI